jgi:uncharacterized protein YciI
MFIVIVRYKVPLPQIDAALEAHRAWLEREFAAGRFILAGPQEPRTGGAILAQGCGRTELMDILAEDPFNQQGLADYEVIEVMARKTDPRLAFLSPA